MDGRPIDPLTVQIDQTPGPADPLTPMRAFEPSGKEISDYHPLMAPEDLANKVIEFVSTAKNVMRSSGIFYRTRLNHNLYYARDGHAVWEENLRPDGEAGDSMYLSVNVAKNAIDHIMSMVTSSKPTIDPVARNTDVKSLETTQIAKAIIDAKLHAEGLISIIDTATKHCPVLGSGFIHGYWDDFAGGALGGNAPAPGQRGIVKSLPDGSPVMAMYKGDAKFENPSMLDVYFDLSAVSWDDVDEVVVRAYRNRYDLIVRYPQAAKEIKATPARANIRFEEYLPSPTSLTTIAQHMPPQQARVEVWYYYHRKTLAVPDGKMQIQLPDGTVLDSGPLPPGCDEMPVCRLCPDQVVGSAHGYAQMTSTGGLQEGLNIGASAMVTNMAAFARRIILAQKGMDIEPSDLTGDLKLLEVEFRPDGRPPVVPLELLGEPDKILKSLEWLIGQIEQDTGANSIIRGDPKGVTAGVAINLYQSMALQFSSPLEAARAKAMEWVANFIIKQYQARPDIERDVQIVGKAKRPMLQNFYGRDLYPIARFVCDPGNPSSRTVAGRLQMLQAIQQNGVPIPPASAFHLLDTGSWDEVTEPMVTQDNLISAENEHLSNGELVPVMPGDDPVLHIRGHLVVGYNPEVRFDQAKMQALNEHMQMHLNQMMQGDILVKVAAGMVPMGPFPPPGAPPTHGEAPPPAAPQGSGGSPGGGSSESGGKPPPKPAPKSAPKGVAPGPAAPAPGGEPPPTLKPPALPAIPRG